MRTLLRCFLVIFFGSAISFANGQTKTTTKTTTTAKKTTTTTTAKKKPAPKKPSGPPWAPPGGLKTRYIYFPDIWMYYDSKKRIYYYHNFGKWHTSTVVPETARGKDLKAARKVELTDEFSDNPSDHFQQHRVKYPKK